LEKNGIKPNITLYAKNKEAANKLYPLQSTCCARNSPHVISTVRSLIGGENI
jgi:hypothetical protein